MAKVLPNTDEPFTPTELDKLVEKAPVEYKLFFLFAFRTGCRLGECLGLHWDDVEDKQVIIKRTCNRRRIGILKNGSERTIDLSEQLVKELN